MPRKAAGAIVLILTLLGLYGLYGHRLGSRDLWSSHEARAAMNAHTLLHGDGPPGVPFLFDGTPELQKPPLFYALVAGVGWIRGQVDALAVRLPATLAALASLALLAFWLGVIRGRPLLAVLATTVLATGIHFTLLARTGRIDMVLGFTTLVAVLGFMETTRTQHRGHWFAWVFSAHLALAAGLLLKGPIAVVLVGAALLPWLVIERPAGLFTLARRWGLLWGLPLVALLVLPWMFWLDAATDGAFFRVFFWEHNLERGLGTGRLRAYPLWYYLPVLGVNFLPWSPLLLAGVILSVSRGWYRDDPVIRVGLAAFLGMLALLSLAAFKRADYLAPLYPWAALLAALPLERAWQRWAGPVALPRALRASLATLLLIALGQVIYTHTALARVEPRREQQTFARTIQGHALPEEPIAQFQTECHLLAFHLGPGREILLQWPDLEQRVRQARSLLVAMPPGSANELAAQLPGMRGERLGDNGRHDRPLVLFRLRSSENELPCPRYPCSR